MMLNYDERSPDFGDYTLLHFKCDLRVITYVLIISYMSLIRTGTKAESKCLWGKKNLKEKFSDLLGHSGGPKIFRRL